MLRLTTRRRLRPPPRPIPANLEERIVRHKGGAWSRDKHERCIHQDCTSLRVLYTCSRGTMLRCQPLPHSRDPSSSPSYDHAPHHPRPRQTCPMADLLSAQGDAFSCTTHPRPLGPCMPTRWSRHVGRAQGVLMAACASHCAPLLKNWNFGRQPTRNLSDALWRLEKSGGQVAVDFQRTLKKRPERPSHTATHPSHSPSCKRSTSVLFKQARLLLSH